MDTLDRLAKQADYLDDLNRETAAGVKKRNELIARARSEGHTLEQIGRAAHVTREAVRQILERLLP